MASPGWVVVAGQCGTDTAPAVTAAAARKGVALDRSGSMLQFTGAMGPGATVQDSSPDRSTATPAERSICTVISMCGIDGSDPPRCATVTPRSNRAADSSRPETNCEDPDASMVTPPPRSAPVPRRVNGSASPSMSAPRSRSASRMVPSGRVRACASPSNSTTPLAIVAAGGRNRMTVPARPQSTAAACHGAGVTRTVVPSSSISMPVPRACSAAIIRSVSRLRSVPVDVDGPLASAASTSARLVIDFEPGSSTVACTGSSTVGALH